jgi:mono/diheme cytochrome c family protein
MLSAALAAIQSRLRPAAVRRLQAIAVPFAICLTLVATVGCGRPSNARPVPENTRSGSSSDGAQVFARAGCGTCHTLRRSHARGQIGPNLDDLKPTYAMIMRQVRRGGNGMPSFTGKLTPAAMQSLARYVVASTATTTRPVLTFVPDGRKPSQCRIDFVCLRQAYGNIAFYKGPKLALQLLDRAQQANTEIAGFCHQITHAIGHAALARYRGDAAKALGQGAMTCWSGYYHGVVERAFSGVARDKVASKARGLCSSLSTATIFVQYQCIHGLGHGLMIYSAGDLFYSLRVCDSLSTGWDRQSCTGGVFMQSFLPPTPGMQMATMQMTLRQSRDLIYPCNAVSAADKLYCYLQITSRILPRVHYNWLLAANWCRRSERGWIRTCYQSLGRDVSGFTREDSKRITLLCRSARSYADECLYGAVRDVTSNDANGRRAGRLCGLRTALDARRCFEGIGSILGGLANSRDGRRALCDESVPLGRRPACYRGAVAA